MRGAEGQPNFLDQRIRFRADLRLLEYGSLLELLSVQDGRLAGCLGRDSSE